MPISRRCCQGGDPQEHPGSASRRPAPTGSRGAWGHRNETRCWGMGWPGWGAAPNPVFASNLPPFRDPQSPPRGLPLRGDRHSKFDPRALVAGGCLGLGDTGVPVVESRGGWGSRATPAQASSHARPGLVRSPKLHISGCPLPGSLRGRYSRGPALFQRRTPCFHVGGSHHRDPSIWGLLTTFPLRLSMPRFSHWAPSTAAQQHTGSMASLGSPPGAPLHSWAMSWVSFLGALVALARTEMWSQPPPMP